MSELIALAKQFHSLGFDLPVDPFIAYLKLLHKWNQTYNLTAIRDPHQMVTHHVLDSLAIRPWIKGPRLLDVGTGAGLPGIPLAIAMPELEVVLLDSNGKKIRFLREVKRALDLPNLEIIQSRAESYRPDTGFDTVTSRALSSLENLVNWTHHLLSDHGIWVAMKGHVPSAELEAINQPYHVETYAVAGITGERCCVILER